MSTYKEKKVFVEAIKEGYPQYKAVMKAFPHITNLNTANIKGGRMMRQEKIREMLDDASEGAVTRVVSLSKHARNEKVKLDANKDILDRAGYKAVDVSKSINLDIKMDISDPKAKAIKEKFEQELFNSLKD